MKVKDIYNFINTTAPFSGQDKFDNSGLLTGSMDSEVKKICLCLDVTHEIIDEAEEKGYNLIISHHPAIFDPLYNVLKDTVLYRLIKNDISLISAHTNFDAYCMSAIMLELLGFPKDGEVLNVINKDGSGYGKIVTLDEPTTAKELAKRVKEAFSCVVVPFVNTGDKEIRRVAICSGAGSGEVDRAFNANCDAFITGQIKWEKFVSAANTNFCLIDAGHFYTENIMCERLRDSLKEKYPELEVYMSKYSRDLCEYV